MPEVGRRVLDENADARKDLARIVQMWMQQLDTSGGPLLFGDFTIADAFFAPVCWRITGYGLPVPAAVQRYIAAVQALPAMRAWTEAALAERDFLAEDEPYRTAPAT